MEDRSELDSLILKQYDELYNENKNRFKDLLKSQPQNIKSEVMPANFNEYIGQNRIKSLLGDVIKSALIRKQPLPHILLSGNAGQGKTVLAYLIAKETKRKLISVVGSLLSTPNDIFAIFEALQGEKNPIVFIDEVHNIPKKLAELLYQPMEIPDTVVMLPSTFGTMTLSVTVPGLTIIGASTEEGKLAKPFYDRFSLRIILDPYSYSDITKICEQTVSKLHLKLSNDIIKSISNRACFTPRILNGLLYRLRDFMIAKNIKQIKQSDLIKLFESLDIDELGLDSIARKILLTLANNNHGSFGYKSLATSCNIDETTLKRIYEPQLLNNNLIAYLSRGRAITEQGMQHLSKTYKGLQKQIRVEDRL